MSLTGNVRNDMYLASEALRVMDKHRTLRVQDVDAAAVAEYRRAVDNATKFIPAWVKIAVALALGLGAMVGWKRIVVTAGKRIGKEHLT
jgi:PiT family inorganic phosphate transporter